MPVQRPWMERTSRTVRTRRPTFSVQDVGGFGFGTATSAASRGGAAGAARALTGAVESLAEIGRSNVGVDGRVGRTVEAQPGPRSDRGASLVGRRDALAVVAPDTAAGRRGPIRRLLGLASALRRPQRRVDDVVAVRLDATAQDVVRVPRLASVRQVVARRHLLVVDDDLGQIVVGHVERVLGGGGARQRTGRRRRRRRRARLGLRGGVLARRRRRRRRLQRRRKRRRRLDFSVGRGPRGAERAAPTLVDEDDRLEHGVAAVARRAERLAELRQAAADFGGGAGGGGGGGGGSGGGGSGGGFLGVEGVQVAHRVGQQRLHRPVGRFVDVRIVGEGHGRVVEHPLQPMLALVVELFPPTAIGAGRRQRQRHRLGRRRPGRRRRRFGGGPPDGLARLRNVRAEIARVT